MEAIRAESKFLADFHMIQRLFEKGEDVGGADAHRNRNPANQSQRPDQGARPVQDQRRATRRTAGAGRTAGQRGWWDAYSDTIHSDYAAYISLEAEAEALRCYDALLIHGLLQTEEYAHDIIRVGLMQFAPSTEIDRRVESARPGKRPHRTRTPTPPALVDHRRGRPFTESSAIPT